MTDVDAVLAFKADTSDLTKSEAALRDVERQGAKTDKVVDQLGNTHKQVTGRVKDNVVQIGSLTRSFKAQKGAAQGVAFQLQDLAVQMQMGTNASRALSQQLPQMLGYFGAGGAILGLFASLGAAAFAPLIDGLFKTKSATEELDLVLQSLDEQMEKTKMGTIGLSNELQELAKTSQVMAAAALQEQILAARDALEESRKAIVSNAKEVGIYSIAQARLIKQFEAGNISATELTEAYDKMLLSSTDIGKEFRANRKDLSDLAGTYTKVESRIKSLTELQARITGGGELDAGKIDSTNKDVASAEARNKKLAEADRKRDESALAEDRKMAFLELRQVEQSLLSREQREIESAARRKQMVRDSFATIGGDLQRQADLEIQIEQDKNAKIAIIREQLAAQAARERALQLMPLKNLLGDMAGLMSSESLKLFRIGQAASMVTATMKGYEAAVSAYAYGSRTGGPVGGAIAAGAAGLATGVQIAQIAKQKPPGRFQGGQVRAGGQYMVGEQGPEIIQMGSSGGRVIPNSQRGAAPIQVINNVKVIGGASDAQVSTTSRQVGDAKFVQDIVVDMMVRPNSPARRGMSSNSNLVNRGSM